MRDPDRRRFLRRTALLGPARQRRPYSPVRATLAQRGLARRAARTFRRGARSLGAPVLASPYGMPSKFEANVRRRESPGPHADAALVGRVHAAAEPVRHHHAVGAALRASPRRRSGDRPAPAPPDDPRTVPQSAHLHDGRPDALPVGVAHPLHRMRREHGHGVGERRRPDRPVLARHDRLLRMDRRAAVDAARRSRVRPQREIPARRGRGRRIADANDRDGDGARRRAGRLRPERRDAATRAGLSAAAARAGRSGRVERQVAAPARDRRRSRGTRAKNRCTTSTCCPAASIASTRGSRKRRA